jgi:hypothetical protein
VFHGTENYFCNMAHIFMCTNTVLTILTVLTTVLTTVLFCPGRAV